MSRWSASPEVNLTPLVDVMLTVLALFMITSPLMLSGPELTLPRASAPTEPPEDTEAVLSVTKDGEVYLRRTRITGNVTQALVGDAAIERSGHLYVRGDRDTPFGFVSRALEDAQAANIQRVNLIVDPLALEPGERP